MNAQLIESHASGWTKFSERRPSEAGVYEWRIPSRAVAGAVLIVAAHMRYRSAGYERALSPEFDYWDGYELHVRCPVEWRETAEHGDLKTYQHRVISVEGLDPCECIYCGKRPKLEAHQRARDGGIVCGPDPWELNSWKFVCCAWGSTPSLSDPREIERIRRAAVAKANGGDA